MPHPHPPHDDDANEHVIRFDRGAGVTRRQALAAMAASMALANTACSPPPKLQAHPYVDLPEARGGGLPLYYASAFVRDGFAQGVLVGTQEGRPIKIEGNAAHPSSLGATDVYAQASVLQLWDPDRSGVVRQRLARHGDVRTPPQLGASTWRAFEAAWRERASARATAPAGPALRVLTGPLTSPTERALLGALLASEPDARWHVHAPLKDMAAEDGARLACGRAVTPVLHFDQARCVLALAADPFSDGPGAVRHAMDWSTARAAARDAASGRPATLFAAEATPGLFGARADHRVALSPARIEGLLWRIASRWMPQIAADAAPPDPAVDGFESRVVAALREAGESALVIGGPGLSAEAHALVSALNRRLGAIGRTVTLIAPPDDASDAGSLAELVDALGAGSVDTLLVIGANPAYDAPPSLDVPHAFARAKLLVHAGLHVDETAALADWHLPLSHAYEQWGDALAHDGSATLLQPSISPLYDTRSAAELLALLADDAVRDGHSLVQRQWRAGRDAGFDASWRRSLRAGVVADSAAPALAVHVAHRPSARPAAPSGLVALFVPDAAAHDGAFANNGWLQELPRPFTKLTWDNAALLSPATAKRLGLVTGDIVQVQVDARSVEAPVWVLAQQADDVVTLPLGCGRRRAGRVGNGVGFDAYALRPASSFTAPVTLRRTGRTHAFAVTQHEIDQHGRELLRTVAAGEALAKAEKHAELYPPFASPVHAWAMVIDLDACIGCNACTIACQAENNIPVVGKEQVARGRDMHWIRVDRHDLDEIGNSAFQPVPCMHCEQAPCEVVCPVGATVHDSEGLNVQVYNRCVGTRFCSNNCPYKVRRFNFLQYSDETTETLKAQRNPDVTVRQRGVMEKCTYCVQRVARARQGAERDGRPLVDGDVVTACQSACPTRAIRFGDKNDAQSDVVKARASQRHYAMLEELDTKPRTTYLGRIKPTA
ncbi:4Fe-4S dicluster domain-containing protein [Scleromatobacter humisilvae]|uniref:4Fe-4S dicluster domain-containing protein n=1 Tax=Scleromatobacter humisilvae TaxID=2897159 RepID=A0A9X1YKX7_9BURK|nr:4Fe-4S dicluster domain-containing protein [Scleromatobacter humisilvae]MCK9686272.1 4Fe-4S dicluster domain-containing protein [Scleromatobacter humisilvae]